MVAATTGVASGKKANTNIGIKNSSARTLIAMPARPSVQCRAGSSSPRMRFARTQPMVII